MESIKRANVRHQTAALFFEHLPDRFIEQVRVFVRFGVGDAAIFEPRVQLRPDERFAAGVVPVIFSANIGLFDGGNTNEQNALCGP